MKISIRKRLSALLLSFALLALCAGSALAAAPSAKTSVGGYTLQKTSTAAGSATLTYSGAGGQMTVTYTAGGQAPQRMANCSQQFATDTVLYTCYSDDFDASSIASVYYQVGSCTVAVKSAGSVDKSTMLAFVEALQASPVPVATGTCAKCGGDVYSHGAQLGGWQTGSSSVCSHGGTMKYKDTQKERSVTITSVCGSCGDQTTDHYTQSALDCDFTGQRYVQGMR